MLLILSPASCLGHAPLTPGSQPHPGHTLTLGLSPEVTFFRPISLCVLGCGSPSSPSYGSSQTLACTHHSDGELTLSLHALTHRSPQWMTANLPSSAPMEDSCHLSPFGPLRHSDPCKESKLGRSLLYSRVRGGSELVFTPIVQFSLGCPNLPRAVPLRWSSEPTNRWRDSLTMYFILFY